MNTTLISALAAFGGSSVGALAPVLSSYVLQRSAAQREISNRLTFDDIDTESFLRISNGYHGLDWSNFYAIDALIRAPMSGYPAGLISPPIEAFNAFGDAASFSSITPFTFTSGYFIGAWNEGLKP